MSEAFRVNAWNLIDGKLGNVMESTDPESCRVVLEPAAMSTLVLTEIATGEGGEYQ